MGSPLSGWYGRRSSRPYFDELPRLAIGDVAAEDRGATWLIWQGSTVRLTRIPQNLGGTALRFFCSRCNCTARVIYFAAAPCCYRCTNARYRTHSERPSRRALRAALKVFRRHKVDYSRPSAKPKWQRWPTFERRDAEAEAVFPVIEAAECFPFVAAKRMRRRKVSDR